MVATRGPQIGAAIDVGSNSVHLLVARFDPAAPASRANLEAIVDQSELVGLGDAVDAGAAISPGALATIADALSTYRSLAEGSGAQRITLIGTEPLRKATNAVEFKTEIAARTGLALHVVSVRQEALLTFIGVTGGRPPSEPLAIVDIGGGSTEIVVHVPGRSLEVHALPVGSARLTNDIAAHDPPTRAELDRMGARVESFARGLPTFGNGARVRPTRAVFVGGTATNVARLGRLSSAILEDDRRLLAQLTARQIEERFEVRPRRARQLAAGAVIVQALLTYFGLGEAEVSTASLREGAVVARSRLDDAWLERLEEIAESPDQASGPVASASH